jgi:dinuclear metal center YbgI/SA1388 family protein
MPVTLRDFSTWLDIAIPLEYQETYDNSGLQVGDPESLITSVLLTLDVTPAVIAEAEKKKCNLILSHHPLIFNPLRRLAGASMAEKTVAESIRKNIAVYSTHTCFDAMAWGVSRIMAEKAGLKDIKVLIPAQGKLFKMAVFVPVSHADIVRETLFATGAGHIGNYSSCSFTSAGNGTFRAEGSAVPYVGEMNKLHTEHEVKIETIIPSHLVSSVVSAVRQVHPYEEIAYDLYPLENKYEGAGSGAIGILPEPITGGELLENLKETFGTPVIRYSGNLTLPVSKVAVCGGSGAGFLNASVQAGANAFITGDIKYHSFTEAPASILVADIGHYESEKFSLTVLYDLIIKKFPKFALRFSEIKTNPINYF